MTAQEISTYKWKNRLVLVLSSSTETADYQKQVQKLKENTEGLAERKIKVFQITPEKFTTDFSKNWKREPSLYDKFSTPNADFEIILIGLDGGKKLRQQQPISTEKLFSTIDVMPMRKAEMRRD
ncbi:DUF4174 domain-containing protein [Mesonia aestuariivivens]|uniref:DUF4174 domain-containing protein n=1 Tax=Mesonia aestuariivivens TaxID=2796128 RepID=A0ABS6W275_9FLAO|nr:DUF4174 domain-containing protein [Mesonia aestuariivivens]MBW2961935.1 DUF4174 domain-containing protein [Mesonia aestuariivivens]